MAWAKNGTPDTLTSPGIPEISDLTARKFNQFLYYLTPSVGNDLASRFNGNTNNVYATRRSTDGLADATFVNQTSLIAQGESIEEPIFVMTLGMSIPGQEKLFLSWMCGQETVGAGTAPRRNEFVGKFVPSPDADITTVTAFNFDLGDFGIDSNLSALGTD